MILIVVLIMLLTILLILLICFKTTNANSIHNEHTNNSEPHANAGCNIRFCGVQAEASHIGYQPLAVFGFGRRSRVMGLRDIRMRWFGTKVSGTFAKSLLHFSRASDRV